MVFSSTGTNEYYPILVKESILKLDPSAELYDPGRAETADLPIGYVKLNPALDTNRDNEYNWRSDLSRLRKLHAEGQLKKLENHDCIESYAVQYQTKGSLLLVTNNSTLDEFFNWGGNGPHTTQKWICEGKSCDRYDTSPETREIWQNPEAWKVMGVPVSYCLVETPPERCRLQLSLPLAIVVVFLNAAKAICMVTMLFGRQKKIDHSPIMNVGDTVASFLDRSEVTTKNMCLASSDDLR